jgi:hypothetical protein
LEATILFVFVLIGVLKVNIHEWKMVCFLLGNGFCRNSRSSCYFTWWRAAITKGTSRIVGLRKNWGEAVTREKV